MQQSLNTHTGHLEEVIHSLDERLAAPDSIAAERVRVLAELRTAQLALLHYRLACALENAME